MIIDSITSEYLRYKRLTERALDQVTDDDLTKMFGSDTNSLAILVYHLAGNLTSRFTDFLTSDGEKSWRHRDREFEDRFTNRDDMISAWDGAWAILLGTLDSLTDDDLARVVTIRGKELTVAAALHRSLAHLSYHVGQIVWMAKACVGDAWQPLSIPKGMSEEYNQNPTLE